MANTGYLPFGFRYPDGCKHNDSNPDPAIESIRKRVAYLNKVHDLSGLPGHIFTAAMALFQSEANCEPGSFWKKIQRTLTMQQVAEIAVSMKDLVKDELPRLDFPNAVALFDCRFVSTQEWEYVRRYSIGGSEAAAILGVAKYHSARTLYLEKKETNLKRRDIGSQHILDYGHAVEPYIIEEFAARLGAKVMPEYRMFAHKDYPFISCNPDGILMFPDGHLALFEAKTAFWKKREEWKQDIPEYYKPQPRHYLEVLDDPRMNGGYIGVCLGGLPKDMLCHSYTRDKTAGAEQIRAVVAFWNNHIVRNEIPPFCGNAELDFKALYDYGWHSDTDGGMQTLSEDSIPLFLAYLDLKAEKKSIDEEIRNAKKTENALREQIKEAAQEGMTVVEQPGKPTYIVKVSSYSTSSVDAEALKKHDPKAAQELMEMAWEARGSRLLTVRSKPTVSKSVPTKKKKGA